MSTYQKHTGSLVIRTSYCTSGSLVPRTQMAVYLSYPNSLKTVSSFLIWACQSAGVEFTLGNLRAYIHDKHKPFPWRLRISFATDITRALAYLHARKCIHRDLKGENLLVTSNGRLKITDFGFARIAARNAEELRRLTFCGTDSYMSPEILLGNEFDLPTDIFSLGVIFAEIASRKLADDRTFKRTAPTFAIDEREIRELASAGCPKDFVQLAIDCLVEEPSKRPATREILERLRACEAEVLARGSEADDIHTGSIKFMSGNKRPGTAPRIPSFGMGIGKDIGNGNYFESDDDSDEELKKAVAGLSKVTVSGDPSSSIIGEFVTNVLTRKIGSPHFLDQPKATVRANNH